jgi:hypothetical protein
VYEEDSWGWRGELDFCGPVFEQSPETKCVGRRSDTNQNHKRMKTSAPMSSLAIPCFPSRWCRPVNPPKINAGEVITRSNLPIAKSEQVEWSD